MPARKHIHAITLDEASFIKRNEIIEAERAVAMSDLLKENYFAPLKPDGEKFPGPFDFELGIDGGSLSLIIRDHEHDHEIIKRIQISLTPFRTVVKEYFMICDTYYRVLKDASPSKIEAIDMVRKSIHNDGASLLMERMKKHVEMDEATARRIFTLICVLHIRV